ncbi:family 78 glycoside hydrolase catalytic domain [Coraliomargarita sp. W4R72]
MTSFSSHAHWLAATVADVPSSPMAHYFRTEFQLKPSVAKAVLRYSALGVVEPWLNGVRVHDDFFTPGWSDYRKRAYVSTYDVTNKVQTGANCLALVLADGWAGAAFGPKGHAVAFAPKTQFIAELVVEYSDGSHEIVATDTDWRWRTGPVRRQSIYHGESYDARKELMAWSEPAVSRRGWKPVSLLTAPSIELTDKKCAPVRIVETLAPIELKKQASVWIADFGQNLVGTLRIRLRNTTPGQQIVLKYAEMPQDDGTLYFDNLRNAEATDVYICEGAEEESYQPRFTFHGFRFAQIEGVSGELLAEDLSACVMHNDLEPTGEFSCSNAKVNQLQSCIRWGQRGNFFEAPTDCPQRDERLGWSGDVQVFVETACFNYDCADFYRQWMDAMRDGQREDGAFPDVAPDILGWHGNAGWGDAGIIVPHAVWLHYGTTTIIEENWQSMKRYIKFLKQRAQGHIQPETVYGDWLAVDAVKPEWGPTPKDLIGTAYYARDVELMARMAGVLGKAAKAKQYTALAEKIRMAFQRRFVTRDGLILGDTQTSYLLALAFDLVPADLIAAAGQRLLARLEARDWHLSTGFIGTPLLNPVLTKIGRSDVAYKLLLQDTYPSWLYPIKNGATTMWERWNSYTKEDGFGPVEMNSFNHYAYGAIGEWLYQSVGGMAPDVSEPGYQLVHIAPQIDGPLRSARLRLKTRFGSFRVSWKRQRENVQIQIEVPVGCRAQLALPTSDWKSILLAGESVPRALKLSRKRAAHCQLSLLGGVHQLSLKLNP